MKKVHPWPYWRNLLLFFLFALSIGSVTAYLSTSYRGARFYLRPDRALRLPENTPEKFGAEYQNITLTTEDEISLAAWYTPPQNGALILVAHGYGAARSAKMHAFFAQHGYGVLSWDARAHGSSEGELCTWGVRETLDVAAALDFATRQESVQAIGGYGQSMGAVTLIEAAGVSSSPIEALVADSAFAHIEDMLAKLVSLPVLRPGIRFFIRLKTGLKTEDLRPVEVIGKISPRAVMILHGLSDSTVPPNAAKRLYENSGEPRQLWTEPGVDHVGLYDAYPERFEEKVISFFDAHLLKE